MEMPQSPSLFSEVKTLVSAELDQRVPAGGAGPRVLRDAMRWSLLGDGKHFRPALVFAVGRVFEAPDHALVGTAAAVEMLHTYSLIHDDLPSMDDDDLRRGRETCHKKFGEATAILAGDALQALAFQTIAEDEDLRDGVRVDLISRLARAAARMVVGQQFDLAAEGRSISAEELETIHRNKTGALIGFSAEAGAIIGGADDRELEIVSEFAERLGLLFQITDDLLDVTQTTEALGKTAGKDVAAAKATFPSLRGIDETHRFAVGVHSEVIEAIGRLNRPADLLIRIADFILIRNS